MDINELNAGHRQITEAAKKKSIHLLICGSYGVYLRSQALRDYLENQTKVLAKTSSAEKPLLEGYKPPRDLDYISEMKYKSVVEEMLTELGFKIDDRFTIIPGIKRSIFQKGALKIDVFYDHFEFNHLIDLTLNFKNKKRLYVSSEVIPATELLLQKLQIVNIGKKDLIDAWWTFHESQIHEEDQGNAINLSLIEYYTQSNWGFYTTIIQNLGRITELNKEIGSSAGNAIQVKVDQVVKRIESSAKGLLWKFRALIGKKVKWYNDVDDV